MSPLMENIAYVQRKNNEILLFLVILSFSNYNSIFNLTFNKIYFIYPSMY